METNLTPEQSKALLQTGGQTLAVFDPATKKKYVLIQADEFAKLQTITAIKNGIEQMENGEGQPLADAFNDIRSAIQIMTDEVQNSCLPAGKGRYDS